MGSLSVWFTTGDTPGLGVNHQDSMEAEERQLSVGDTVLCRAKGMESWPARVVDQNMEQLGEEVQRSKPRGKKHLLV